MSFSRNFFLPKAEAEAVGLGIERINRTIQEECVTSTNIFSEGHYGKAPLYLAYYNEGQLHFGVRCQTAVEILQKS